MDDSSDGSSTTKHQFMLFVSGMSVKSGHAIENLRKICDQYLKDDYELEIIDISRDTEQAAIHQIVAIPTLIKINPAPRRIILGDLSDKEKVLKILNIRE
ncbi:circadian clock protein KaiB [Flavobacterium piscis]|jgi:circadian clock protein KaiB|uniref:Circadian clock protein KaiB n=1 Tax=Flavobacterium piscis TaxID=1114874 RepID=A0ABX2XHH6_9FLAO|nr:MULTISPECIES: circadian clock KaiB family protein [Flavobacterium]MCA1919944.1 circadian clock KaiB family protein [Flavobacterium piscis]OCB73417.1 circadian clock protein KaiB [Flavobacterium piscis]OXE98956.1 circadian clock protein KaiB [Flavobacterium piscis]QDW21440.1 circadian clock protein KaiB [Flavobacterium sp. KBS0721]